MSPAMRADEEGNRERIVSTMDRQAGRDFAGILGCWSCQLTPDERLEYEAYVQASTLIGILQTKARRVLAQAKVG